MSAQAGYQVLPQCPDKPLIRLYETVSCPLIEKSQDFVDSVHMAAQIGRLDLVTVVLAVLTIVLAFAAIGWGSIVWRQATFIAKKTAEDETETYVGKYLQEDGEATITRAVVEWLGKPENRDLILPSTMTEDQLSEMFRGGENGDGGDGGNPA